VAAVDLMMAGYRRVYFFGYPPPNSPANALIHRGLIEARDDHRAPLAESHLLQIPRGSGSVEYMEGLRALMSGVESGSGIVLLGASHGETVRKALAERGLEVPEDVGLVSVELPGDNPCAVDQLEFGRDRIMERAMALAVADRETEVRELVSPVRVSRGTVRGAQAGR
jgi:DNA-binding LacI/PurR family transcriptional regulator